MAEPYPIFDGDGMPHFPCGDDCHLCNDGQPICWDCQAPWPCEAVRALAAVPG